MLHFNGLEPIDFKGKHCEPKVDAEKKLRLQNAKFDTEANIRTADDILASCFDEDYAKDFIRDKLSTDDKILLRTYLVGGETAVNRMSEVTNGAIEEYIKRAMEENNE